LTVPSQYIYSLMSFFIGNQEKFQTNLSVHNINTRNKHHLHRPVANLSCFQKGVSFSGIRIFNSLPRSITNLKNEKTQCKLALKKVLNAHSFYSVDEFFTCIDDMYYWLYDCINISYTVIFLSVCMFMTCSTSYCLVSRIYGMYICMYVMKWTFYVTLCVWYKREA
jgi:hypothetical protein